MKTAKLDGLKLNLASDHECINCDKQAKYWFGLADPDIQRSPLCKDCADKAQMALFIEMGKEMTKRDLNEKEKTVQE